MAKKRRGGRQYLNTDTPPLRLVDLDRRSLAPVRDRPVSDRHRSAIPSASAGSWLLSSDVFVRRFRLDCASPGSLSITPYSASRRCLDFDMPSMVVNSHSLTFAVARGATIDQTADMQAARRASSAVVDRPGADLRAGDLGEPMAEWLELRIAVATVLGGFWQTPADDIGDQRSLVTFGRCRSRSRRRWQHPEASRCARRSVSRRRSGSSRPLWMEGNSGQSEKFRIRRSRRWRPNGRCRCQRYAPCGAAGL